MFLDTLYKTPVVHEDYKPMPVTLINAERRIVPNWFFTVHVYMPSSVLSTPVYTAHFLQLVNLVSTNETVSKCTE